jgi:hypothetical protein
MKIVKLIESKHDKSSIKKVGQVDQKRADQGEKDGN